MRLPVKTPYGITAAYNEINTDYWKDFHKGIDFVTADSDKGIYAVCAGTVQVVDNDENGWGNYVSVMPDYDGNSRHIYAHLDSVSVRKGERVMQNEKLGIMGKTGNASGVHLHFELREDGKPADPTTVLGIKNERAKYISWDVLDNTPDEYAIRALSWARANGIILGDEHGDMSLHDGIKRQDVVVMLYRTMKGAGG